MCLKNNNNHSSRRSFIKKTGIAGSLFSISSLTFPSLFSTSTDDERILVIGAGLAGLSCAYELDKAGFNVMLIEARSRPGGRVSTYRNTFSDNLYSEMGAEYVDSTDFYVQEYCRKFNLKVLPAKQYDGIYLRGNRLSMKGLKFGNDILPYKGTSKGKLFGQEVQYIQKWIDLVKKKGITSAEVMALDKISVEDILKKGGAPKDIIDLYTYANATEETTVPSKISALYMILENSRTSSFSENTVEGRIFGGNDQLPKILAENLKKKIMYNTPLLRLDHDSNGILATVKKNEKFIKIPAKKCVLAIPTSILRNIEVNPSFSFEKTECIHNQQYGHAMKIAMQFQERFWEDYNSIGQRVFTDTQLRRIYHFSIDQPGPRGILLSFTSAEDAIQLGRLNEKDRLRIIRNTCKSIWPKALDYWEKAIIKYWNEDPWVKGSYSFAGVNQKKYTNILAKKEGSIFFAGEHTAIQRASMNGAIESGFRVFEELKNSK